jgi:hypothetical protein
VRRTLPTDDPPEPLPPVGLVVPVAPGVPRRRVARPQPVRRVVGELLEVAGRPLAGRVGPAEADLREDKVLAGTVDEVLSVGACIAMCGGRAVSIASHLTHGEASSARAQLQIPPPPKPPHPTPRTLRSMPQCAISYAAVSIGIANIAAATAGYGSGA